MNLSPKNRTSKTQGTERLCDLAWALALALITLGLLWPSAEFDAINYDDPVYLTQNGYVERGLTWEGIEWALWDDYWGYPHPLTWISFMATTSLLGDSPAAYRIVNILLHIGSVALVFLLIRRFLPRDRLVALFVAAVFAWHPTRLESVIWISERKDVLSGLFLLLTLHGYLGYKARPSPGRYLALVFLPFLLSTLAKPTTVVIPCLLLLMDYWPLRRFDLPFIFGASFRNVLLSLKGFTLMLPDKIPLFAISFFWGGAAWRIAQNQNVNVSWDVFTLGERMANLPVTYGLYLLRFFSPENLALFRPHPFSFPLAWQVALGVILLGGITLAVLACTQKTRGPFVAWFWFVGILFPVTGLMQNGGQLVAYRYTYLSYIGLALLVALVCRVVFLKYAPRSRVIGPFAVASFAGFLAMETTFQLPHWQNSITIWQHCSLVTRDNFVALSNLAAGLRSMGRAEEALLLTKMARDIHGRHSASTEAILGYLIEKEDFAAAISEFGRLEPEINRWVALAHRVGVKNRDQDFWNSRNAMENKSVWENRANLVMKYAGVLTELGKHQQALERFDLALQLSPDGDLPLYSYRIARSAAVLGRFEEAIHILTRLQALFPDAAEPPHLAAVVISQMPPTTPESLRRALEYSRRAYELEGNVGTHILTHAYILAKHSETDADAFVEKALQPYPPDVRNAILEIWLEYRSGRAEYPHGIGLPLKMRD